MGELGSQGKKAGARNGREKEPGWARGERMATLRQTARRTPARLEVKGTPGVKRELRDGSRRHGKPRGKSEDAEIRIRQLSR